MWSFVRVLLLLLLPQLETTQNRAAQWETKTWGRKQTHGEITTRCKTGENHKKYKTRQQTIKNSSPVRVFSLDSVLWGASSGDIEDTRDDSIVVVQPNFLCGINFAQCRAPLRAWDGIGRLTARVHGRFALLLRVFAASLLQHIIYICAIQMTSMMMGWEHMQFKFSWRNPRSACRMHRPKHGQMPAKLHKRGWEKSY